MRRCPMRRCPMRRCPMRAVPDAGGARCGRCPMRRCPMRRCPMRAVPDAAVPHPEPRSPSRQSANVLACAASASTVPPGPRASAAAHAGSAGSTRHDDPGPASVAPWPPFRITPTVFPGPKDVARSGAVPMRSGANRVQARPLPSGQAAIRLVSAPDPARSNATTPPPAAVSRTTSISSPASDPGTAGPAACQLPSRSAKRPAIPLRLQLAASIGTPDPPNAAAIRPPTPQALPAGVAASTAALARRVHVVPPPVPSSAVPPLVSAMRRPPAPLARASGASARPGVSGPAGDQLVPPSPEVASGEKVRSWLGRNPVTSDPPVPATSRPPLSATPAGVASRHRAAPAGRTKSSQKLSCWAAGPPMSTIARPAPAELVKDVASGGAAGIGAGPGFAALVPQPAASTQAAAITAPAAVRAVPGAAQRVTFMTASTPAGSHWSARRRTTIRCWPCPARGRS